MSRAIDVIGLGADGAAGLRPEQIERILAADFLAGGARHLAHFPQARGERFAIRDNLAALFAQLRDRRAEQRCVVLASGDPLFYGIGRSLVRALGDDNVRLEPALSAMQLAFARAGLSWQDAALTSVHGRDPRTVLLPLLGKPLLGLFTQDGDSPAAVARFLERYRLGNYYAAVVCENLGTADERVTHWANLHELAGRRFGALNYLILERVRYPSPLGEVEGRRALAPGIPDEEFSGPTSGPEMLTHQEVRTVILGKLLLPTEPGDTVWDVGAGLGTVSVELAVLRPHLEVVAVERDPARASWVRRNRQRFGCYNLRVVVGEAPDALEGEAERPRLVFVGGSGGRLAALLAAVGERLREGGRLVASFVTLENLALALEHVRRLGWPFDVTEVHVARSDALGGLTALKPLRGVFVLRTDRPVTLPAPAAGSSDERKAEAT